MNRTLESAVEDVLTIIRAERMSGRRVEMIKTVDKKR
jgi:hypothetical protein